MNVCLDVHYRGDEASVAGVYFRAWSDDVATETVTARIEGIEPYEPGHFYKRELPCLMAVLERAVDPLEAVVVDGYVWLDERMSPGLGARLHEALRRVVPVIGVAKTAFKSAAPVSVPVARGTSSRPLFVTAAGVDVREAAAKVAAMHGRHRVPTLLKLVDRLSRQGAYGHSPGGGGPPGTRL